MSLPAVNGVGFLLTDGVELKYSAGGNAWARMPLSFKNRRRDSDGNWSHDKEIVIDAMVFGTVAEFLADNVSGREEIAVSGELYLETYAKKTGGEGTSVKMRVLSAAPVGGREKVVTSSRTVSSAADDDAPPF